MAAAWASMQKMSSAAVLEASFCAHPQKTFLCALSVTHNRENENCLKKREGHEGIL